MWKRLDESLSLSEKHARLSWEAFGLWVYLLSNSDAKGRFSGDARVIKARCMTYREAVRLEQVEDALSELERERVLHLYHVGPRRYIQIHDHDSWNPPGALRYQDPKHPAPPDDLCECVRRESGVKTPLVSSSSSSPSASEGVQGEPDHPPPKRPPSKPGVSHEALLVSVWNDQPRRDPISPAKGVRFVETAVAAGVPMPEIEAAFWDSKVCDGKKIWEVLDPLKAKYAKTSRLEEFVKERDARGPRKL